MKTFLIYSHQHEAWWRANGRGYSQAIGEAGHYVYPQNFLRWAEHREFLADGRPHEVVVELPDRSQVGLLQAMANLGEAIDQATTEAIVARSGQRVKP